MATSSRLLLLVLLLSATVSAQSPTYHLGRTPTPDEVRAWDIAISPDGHELPPGHGTAKEGRDVFIEKGCVQCHGRNGEGGKARRPGADDGDVNLRSVHFASSFMGLRS